MFLNCFWHAKMCRHGSLKLKKVNQLRSLTDLETEISNIELTPKLVDELENWFSLKSRVWHLRGYYSLYPG